MAKEFKMFKGQYDINIKALLSENNKMLTGVDYLIVFFDEYNR